uniref:Leucine-rich repeat-containing N-terminal plant-type domain-containing protein n=1 Tax=Oryza meridionalis TaxID=40149 RepID=A0A0E0E8Y6_9ORYZ
MVIFDNSQSYTFHLTGRIPDSLGAISEIETIRTDHNFLTGKIPISLSNMKSLSILNLSHNNLSGTIHMALDNLQFLAHFSPNLSDNNLKGEVPTNGVLKNSTAIPLNGNCDLCGGLPDLHMPPCYTDFQRKQIQYHLVRVLIPGLCLSRSPLLQQLEMVKQAEELRVRYDVLYFN